MIRPHGFGELAGQVARTNSAQPDADWNEPKPADRCNHYETKTDPGDCEECVCSECGGWLADEPGGSDRMCGRCVDDAVANQPAPQE